MHPTQCRMARSGLNWRAQDLAEKAGVGYATVARFESGKAIAADSLLKMQAALEAAGAQFTKRADRLFVGVTPSGNVRLPSTRKMIAEANKMPDGSKRDSLLKGLLDLQGAQDGHRKLTRALGDLKRGKPPE